MTCIRPARVRAPPVAAGDPHARRGDEHVVGVRPRHGIQRPAVGQDPLAVRGHLLVVHPRRVAAGRLAAVDVQAGQEPVVLPGGRVQAEVVAGEVAAGEEVAAVLGQRRRDRAGTGTRTRWRSRPSGQPPIRSLLPPWCQMACSPGVLAVIPPREFPSPPRSTPTATGQVQGVMHNLDGMLVLASTSRRPAVSRSSAARAASGKPGRPPPRGPRPPPAPAAATHTRQ